MDKKETVKVVKEGLPLKLKHKPIIAANYQRIVKSQKNGDYPDAKFLSIGRAQYNGDECSVKVFRTGQSGGRWSRQSEEVPIQRLPYMMVMLLAAIYRVQNPEDKDFCSGVGEEIVASEDISIIERELGRWNVSLVHGLKDIRQLLGKVDIDKLKLLDSENKSKGDK